MMPGRSFVLLTYLGVLVLCSCQEKIATTADILARVGPFHLHLEDLPDHLLDAAMAPADSAKAIAQYTRTWAKDKAFELKAMESIDDTELLDQMTEDYRSSLRKHLYERQLFDESIDTTISHDRLNDYYEANKEQYILESSIYRLHYLKMDKRHPSTAEVQRLWDQAQDSLMLDSLILLAHEVAELFLLDQDSWYSKEDLSSVMPDKVKEHLDDPSFKDRRLSGDSSLYLLRVYEQFADTDVAPLSFIEKQARQILLFQKKQQLLRARRDQIYEEAIKRNRIQFYEN